MSGHPQGGHYDDGYGQTQGHPQGHPQGQQGQDAYYHDDQYGQYHDDAPHGAQYQQQGHNTDSYYDEQYVPTLSAKCLINC
jgi:1,3-beta-glucan synthase